MGKTDFRPLLGALLTFISLNLMALETPQIQRKKKFSPIQERSIIATETGYFPKNIVIFEGETLKLYFTSTKASPTCLLMPEQGIKLVTYKGEVTETSFKGEEVGSYEFYCPTGKLSGKVTVLKRPETKEEKEKRKRTLHEKAIKRGVASVEEQKAIGAVWIPKERPDPPQLENYRNKRQNFSSEIYRTRSVDGLYEYGN